MTASAALLALTLTPTQRSTAEGRSDQPAPVKTGRAALAESSKLTVNEVQPTSGASLSLNFKSLQRIAMQTHAALD